MTTRKTTNEEELKFRLYTRVNQTKYNELRSLLQDNPHNDMSRLLRDILHDRPITVFTKDHSLDDLMEELAKLRSEVRAIGVNINQITRHFNTYPEQTQKLYFAKMAFNKYADLQPAVNRILEIISKLSIRWLSN